MEYYAELPSGEQVKINEFIYHELYYELGWDTIAYLGNKIVISKGYARDQEFTSPYGDNNPPLGQGEHR